MKPSEKSIRATFRKFPKTAHIIVSFLEMPDGIVPALFWRNIRFLIEHRDNIFLIHMNVLSKELNLNDENIGWCDYRDSSFVNSTPYRSKKRTNDYDVEPSSLYPEHKQYMIGFEDGNLSTLIHEIQHVRQIHFFKRRWRQFISRMPRHLKKRKFLINHIVEEYILFIMEVDAFKAGYHSLPDYTSELLKVDPSLGGCRIKSISKHFDNNWSHEDVAESYGLDSFPPVARYAAMNVSVYRLLRCPPKQIPLKKRIKTNIAVIIWRHRFLKTAVNKCRWAIKLTRRKNNEDCI